MPDECGPIGRFQNGPDCPTSSLNWRERLNFLITNRVPRRLLTQWMGWYSRIESPWLTRISIRIWRLFARDLDLTEARESSFTSLHACFVRELKEGRRPIDERPDIVVSPCDAIVGACGNIEGTTLYQAKGFPYELGELIPDAGIRERHRDGIYVTLRLKSSMYHRFHAPLDCDLRGIDYISGDTWNVNPPTLKCIERLYCKNERAILPLHTDRPEDAITLVPVAAILVASMRFHALGHDLDLNHRGPNHLPCRAHYARGEEMGYFQHGSTIILFASRSHALCNGIATGKRINMGEALLRIL